MARMKPIIVPSASRIEINSPTQEKKDVSKEDVDTLDDLSKRLAVLRARINKAMTSKNIVNLQQPIVKESTEIPAYVPTTKVSTKVHNVWPSDIVQSQNGPSAQAAFDSQNDPSMHSSFVQNCPLVHLACVPASLS